MQALRLSMRRPIDALGHARLLLVGVWLGAAMFFSFAVAPSAFAVLPARELAGAIVTRTIGIVNVGGLLISLLLLATAFAAKRAATKRAWTLEMIALAVVALATGIGHWMISARMQALRLSMRRPIDEIAQNDPARVAFNNLHGYSVAAMTTAMLAAVVAFILIARRNKKSGV
jgi:ABC-type transport system involved in cytochrome bd biosynthesis fused ATPase/permease subunit